MSKSDLGSQGGDITHCESYGPEYVRALEKRHAKEREIDRAKISSLEAYVEKIHAEFTKNKQLMQMLVNKVEADQRLIE